MRGSVRRGETEPWPGACEVLRQGQGADPGVPECNCAEPEVPRLPVLLLAGYLAVPFRRRLAACSPHRPSKPMRPLGQSRRNQTFSTRPTLFEKSVRDGRSHFPAGSGPTKIRLMSTYYAAGVASARGPASCPPVTNAPSWPVNASDEGNPTPNLFGNRVSEWPLVPCGTL